MDVGLRVPAGALLQVPLCTGVDGEPKHVHYRPGPWRVGGVRSLSVIEAFETLRRTVKAPVDFKKLEH